MPRDLVSIKCKMHLPQNEMEETSQLLSLSRGKLKQSTPSVPGLQSNELNRSNFVFLRFANRSMSYGHPTH